MNIVDKATETQLNNIQKKTGKTLADLTAIVQTSGLSKHGEIRAMLQREFELGYGDAAVLAHYAMQTETERASKAQGVNDADMLNEIYAGAKSGLRPIHEKLMQAIGSFGEFEVAPKKGYVSLRRKRQFAMLGPATNTRFELGLNHKALGEHPRLVAQPAGSMCNYKVKLTEAGEVDDELIAWVRQAYEAAE